MKLNTLMNILRCHIFSLSPVFFCFLIVCHNSVVENVPYAGR